MVGLDYDCNDPEYWAWLEAELRSHRPWFARTEYRHTRLKRRLDCSHWIDGGEPYRYQVWLERDSGARIAQRTDCEFCARRDNRY